MTRAKNRLWSALVMCAATLLAPMAMAATTPPPAPLNPLFPPGIGFNPVVDYTKPNFSQSPNIRKFIDSLPGLGAANQNNLKQYIPVAVPDKNSYPGSDYYELGLKQFNQQMNSDLPATGSAIRGYYQKNGPDTSAQYLGPAIIANRDRPVRVKFFNELATGSAGDLFLPVDLGVMGAGSGPNGGNFTQNRADIHLHGGLTPWISDGTPHQWVTPAGDATPYKKGASFQNVPDMVNGSVVNGFTVPCSGGTTCFTPAPGDGIGTYFYPNQQSSRLMFYHDHSYGITRLNVYAGEAAPYLLVDPVEEDLIAGTNTSGKNTWGLTQILPDQSGLDKSNTGLYRYGIPLVIQDKSFVNDASTPSAQAVASFPDPVTGYARTPYTLSTDPLWQYYVGTGGGNLWLPHEYMPIENMFDPTGNTSNGRWDYAPFMNPPMVPIHLTLPSPTIVPESFVDTQVVNGTAFPYLELPPDTVRFRILNASNDRSLNLQVYKADPLRINVTNGGTGYTTPVVAITGNAGTYTAATAIVSPGTISSIDVVGATHYVFPPTVTLTNAPGDTGTCTSVTATIPSNTSGTVEVTALGCTGFTAAPTVTLTGGGGGTYTSATATIIPKGVITAITVTGATGYRSDLPAPTVTITDTAGTGINAAAVAFVNTEVKMVDAFPNPAYPTWPKDGRDGGVPDPTTAGPPWIQIGNEAGLMAQAAVWPQQPINYEYTRQNLPTLGVTSKSLLLMSAMRADVILDLRGYNDGDTLIVYNDAPAALPGLWAINDYYTDSPDLTGVGGAPSIPPGFGPNTRTVMQIRIKGTKTSTFTFDLNALKTALPQAFAASQDKPLVPQLAYNAAYPGFATFDTYAQNYFDTLNLTGIAQPLLRIKTTAPGNNYVTPPTVNIIGGGGTGARATAGLNPCGGITLLTAGTGYTSPPTVTIGAPGAGGVQATAVATISGGLVSAITIDEPGSNYSTALAPTCTITGGGGTGATCSAFVAVANTVGSIRLNNAGTGYTSQPYIYLTGGGGTGAMAVAELAGAKVFTGKNLTEGFDPDYGRMDIRLGSTPNPLTPNVGNGIVIGLARYIDPPTELLNDAEVILWRLTHLGVDSHSMHFHLFNVQVVNRVDWTNVVKPPYPDELGWRETIRTNPMEDIIVAIQPKSMTLPFPIPKSNRLLDVTTPINSTTNFLPVAPPVGIPAVPQISNVPTDFGWEYVWHCHLLGHEENDMMRPLVLFAGDPVATVAPSALTFGAQTVGVASTPLTVTLSNTATVGVPLFIGSIGVTGANAGEFVQTNTCGASLAFGTSCTISVTFTPGGAGARTARLAIATSDTLNPTRNVALSGTGVVAPAAPSNLTAIPASPNSIGLSWTDNSNNETSFAVWSSVNGAPFTQIGTVARTGAASTGTGGTVTFTNSALTTGNSYAYYVTAVNIAGPSAPTATVTVTAPLTPTNPAASIASATSITVSWTDSSNNETSFQVWSSLNGAPFTQVGTVARTGAATTGTGAIVSFTHTGLTTGNTYSYYVTASNVVGTSLPSTTVQLNLTSGLPSPWLTQDVGAVGVAGSAAYQNGIFSLQGSGTDIYGTADAFRFVYQTLTGDGQIIARVASLQNTSGFAKGGVMIRQTLAANSMQAMMDVTPTSGAEFSRRLTTGGTTAATVVAGRTAPYWVKLVRSGNTFTGSISADGVTWTQVGTPVTIAMGTTAFVGLIDNSHSNTRLCAATFDGVAVSGASVTAPTVVITSPANSASFIAPATVPITATPTPGAGATVSKVDFFAGTTLVGTATAAPYTVTWNNVVAGIYSLTAQVTDSLGGTVTSAPVSITVDGLPAPWATQDIGTVGVAGKVTYLNGTYTLLGSGTDIWGTADSFRFVYKPLTGDGQIIARVASLQNTNTYAKGGVMIRQALTANSSHAMMDVTPGNGAEFSRRTTTGGTTAATTRAGIAAPYWVRLVRTGNTFTGSVSTDGVTWVQVGTATITMTGTVYVGLIDTSHSNATLCTATFDSVQ